MTKEEIIALGVPEDIAEKVLTQHTAELTRPSSSERYTIINFNSHAHTERDPRCCMILRRCCRMSGLILIDQMDL